MVKAIENGFRRVCILCHECHRKIDICAVWCGLHGV